MGIPKHQGQNAEGGLERSPCKVVPVLYYLTADKVEAEYINPHSQERVASRKVSDKQPPSRTSSQAGASFLFVPSLPLMLSSVGSYASRRPLSGISCSATHSASLSMPWEYLLQTVVRSTSGSLGPLSV